MAIESIEVLLVEDTPTDAMIVREVLMQVTGVKFSVTVVERLAEALKKVKDKRFDVALLDLGLPDSKGFETFERLHSAAAEIPVVVLSGRADEILAVKAVQAGAQDYLVKGNLDEPVLARAIRYAIERKRSEEVLRRQSRMLEQKNNELTARNEELLWKNAFFEAQVDSAIDGILIVDTEGKKTLQNQRMVDMWQIPEEIAADTTDIRQLEWVTKQTKDPGEFLARVAHLTTHHEEISRDEIELINGKILDRYSAPVLGKSGDSYGRIWIFRDVTEERTREETLSRALLREQLLAREAKAGDLAKSEFLAAMSHEIRTPMNAILGFSELLAQTSDLPEDCRDYVQTISSSGEALLRILNDVLDHSRLEANGLRIEKRSFSPREVLQDIHTMLSPHAEARRLDFQIEMEKNAPDLLWNDAGRLRQALLNITSNAIKFTEHGSVTLGLKRSETGEASVEFFVRDTGPGIPEDRCDDIFKPFIQLDSSISRRYGGTGLGLSISRNLVELMGGKLTLSSQIRSGSEFHLMLPSEIPLTESTVTSEMSEEALNESFAVKYPLRLLLVEDDRINLKLMLLMLQKLGYAPLVARDGVEAVETYQNVKVECILMDLQMPRQDGFEATLNIRKLEQATSTGQQVFISALTANIVAEDQQRCFDVGMNAYLNKPIRRALLAQALMEACRFIAQGKGE